MTDVLIDQLLKSGGPVAGVLVTMVACWKLYNSIWKTAADTLRETAAYAKEENTTLRERLDEIDKRNIDLSRQVIALERERAQWHAERMILEQRIARLESQLAQLQPPSKEPGTEAPGSSNRPG